MKTETISISLDHYRDKDYECKNSKLEVSVSINDGTKIIELTGIRAEAFFRTVMEMADQYEKQEQDDKECCICGEVIEGYGNNPSPVKEKGRCCDKCNMEVVIPKRLEDYK